MQAWEECGMKFVPMLPSKWASKVCIVVKLWETWKLRWFSVNDSWCADLGNVSGSRCLASGSRSLKLPLKEDPAGSVSGRLANSRSHSITRT
eukprot:755136-Amphidinium_carterae.1